MIYIVGGRGRLGRALSQFYTSSQSHVLTLERREYENWGDEGAETRISRFFENSSPDNATVFVASGILDPRCSIDAHMRINYTLPRNIIDGATRAGLKVVTFGTIMENIKKTGNPYIQSKIRLGEYVSDISPANPRVVHMRIHTLFGCGLPSPFMFLGQILHSIESHTVFDMTPGNQLREYHHVEDEVAAIDTLISNDLSGSIDLSHGQAVKLKDIATRIYDELGLEELLNIGALPEPEDENYREYFRKNELLGSLHFRDTLPSIVQYIKECLHITRHQE